jgi:DNA-binding transcriptional LysR family regulator
MTDRPIPDAVEQMVAKARRQGIHITTRWDLGQQRDILREQRGRAALTPYGRQLDVQARQLVEDLAGIVDLPPAALGEALLFAAAYAGGLALQGADTAAVVNVIAHAAGDLLDEADR